MSRQRPWKGREKHSFSTPVATDTGVVVEEIRAGSGLHRAGAQPGDLLVGWQRPPSPPADPHGARGEISAVFDWLWLKVEQVPRGPVRLTGRRNRQPRFFEVASGPWEAQVRPQMPVALLDDYLDGRGCLEAGDPEAAAQRWGEVAEAPAAASWSLVCWIHLLLAEAWGRAGRWDHVDTAYDSAWAQARSPLSQVVVAKAKAEALKQQGKFELARQAYQRAQEIRERHWGYSLAFAEGLDDLGQLALDLRDLARAQDYLERALDVRKALAPGSPQVASNLYKLGVLAEDRGDPARALASYKTAIDILEQLAPQSLDLAASLSHLGTLAMGCGELVVAVDYYERALVIQERLAPDSLVVAGSLENLARVARECGETELVDEYTRQARWIRHRRAHSNPGADPHRGLRQVTGDPSRNQISRLRLACTR